MDTLKIVLLGDGGVGKTSLLMHYFMHILPEYFVPTVCDIIMTEYCLENTMKFGLEVHDTAGAEDFIEIIKLVFPGTDCFLLCYSVLARKSAENHAIYWIPKIKSSSVKNSSIVFCGTKTDLIQNYHELYITTNEVKDIVGPNYEMFEVSTFDEAATSTREQGQIAKVIEACVRNAMHNRARNIMNSPAKCFLC